MWQKIKAYWVDALVCLVGFDKIKIDKSFVSHVETTPQNAKTVTAILALARSMDIKVTAEGIETDEALNFLSDRKCRQGQGFLFAKAMDAEAVLEFLGRADGSLSDMGARQAS